MNLHADTRGALELLLRPGDVYELRVLETERDGTVSGYFNDLDVLAEESARWSGHATGVYTTLNPAKPELLARAANHTNKRVKPGAGTSDADILRRDWLQIDFDPIRPSGISSTDAEHGAAWRKAVEFSLWLRELGFHDDSIILADSGNGAHVLIRVDLPNDGESKELIRRCLKAADTWFSDDVVHVD
jgi:hypothetical protein